VPVTTGSHNIDFGNAGSSSGVSTNDVEGVSVIPALRLVNAAVEPLERLSGWGGLRKRKQRNEQRCEDREASCHGFAKENNA
jgi:hypothetical protein